MLADNGAAFRTAVGCEHAPRGVRAAPLTPRPVARARAPLAPPAQGFLTLASNSSVAFLLNLATLALIKHTSALTLNVAGVVKDLLLILWSVVRAGALVSTGETSVLPDMRPISDNLLRHQNGTGTLRETAVFTDATSHAPGPLAI